VTEPTQPRTMTFLPTYCTASWVLITGSLSACVAIEQSSKSRIAKSVRMKESNIAANFGRLAVRKNFLFSHLHFLNFSALLSTVINLFFREGDFPLSQVLSSDNRGV
jgi:hypothetical protein